VTLDRPLPRAAILWLFVLLPLSIATTMVVVVTIADRLLGDDNLPSSVILVSISVYMLANGVRSILSCVDWFEARYSRERPIG
jgi:hypothetical protein